MAPCDRCAEQGYIAIMPLHSERLNELQSGNIPVLMPMMSTMKGSESVSG